MIYIQVKIRVGTRIYRRDGGYTDPTYPEFRQIFVLTKSTEYGSIGPYELKDENDAIMENVWQFQKVYKTVPKIDCQYSRYDRRIIWSHPAETHVDSNGALTPEYWNWRKKGFACKDAVRYPVGMQVGHQCLYAITDDGEKLDYIQGRKKIYMPVYCNLVREAKQYKDLQQMLEHGEKLLIIEVDGPHQESLDYYKAKYGVGSDFIQQSTIIANFGNLKIMLNDDKHAFGHGYCLAAALLGIDGELAKT